MNFLASALLAPSLTPAIDFATGAIAAAGAAYMARRAFKKPQFTWSPAALRKLKATAARKTIVAASRSALARSMVVPGYTRSVGNYGRFNSGQRGSEKKFFDTALSFNFDSTGEVPATGQLTLIPQGDTESTRDGRKATIRSIQIRGHVQLVPSTGATSNDIAYIWVVQDTQCNGAAAAFTDVFSGTVADTCLINLNNSGRFRILKKIVVPLNPMAGTTTAYNNLMYPVECYLKCNIVVDWSSTTGAITEIRSNNIFLLAGSAGADDASNFVGNARLRFTG